MARNDQETQGTRVARSGAKLRAKSKTKVKKEIPEFKTIQEEAEFWDTHDSTDYFDESDEVHDIVFVRPEVPIIEVSRPLWAKLLTLSQRKHTTPNKIVIRWIREMLSRAGSVYNEGRGNVWRRER